MKYLKIAVALPICTAGLLMPWRMRCLFSEALGWVAQLVPPELHNVEGDGPNPTAH